MNLQRMTIIALAPLAVAGAANAAFTGYGVESSTTGGLVTYRVFAQFTGGTETLLRAYNIHAVAGDLGGFVHNDIVSGSQSSALGSWNPNFVLGPANDSYLCIGGPAVLGGGNTTLADAGWINGWNSPSIPDLGTTGIAGWYNSLTENLQGRVDGNGRVLVGQFVLDAGHAAKTISLRISHNTSFGSPVAESQGTFSLVPSPGPVALLALAGFAARRRR
jgi:hypothetical protein